MVDGYCEVIPRPKAAVSSLSGVQHQFSGEDVQVPRIEMLLQGLEWQSALADSVVSRQGLTLHDMQRVTPYVHEAWHQFEPPHVVTEWLILLIEIHRLVSSVLNIREDNSGRQR